MSKTDDKPSITFVPGPAGSGKSLEMTMHPAIVAKRVVAEAHLKAGQVWVRNDCALSPSLLVLVQPLGHA